MASSFLTPITESDGPVIPTSVMKAVPPGSTRSSAVCTCVWVPSTALTFPSKCHASALFRGRFGVKIDDNDRCFLPQPLYLAFGCAEGILEVRHEHPALEVEHRRLRGPVGRQDDAALSNRTAGIVCRADEVILLCQIRLDLLLVPDMVARGKHMDAEREKLIGDGRRDPNPPRSSRHWR